MKIYPNKKGVVDFAAREFRKEIERLAKYFEKEVKDIKLELLEDIGYRKTRVRFSYKIEGDAGDFETTLYKARIYLHMIPPDIERNVWKTIRKHAVFFYNGYVSDLQKAMNEFDY